LPGNGSHDRGLGGGDELVGRPKKVRQSGRGTGGGYTQTAFQP
jgi:hypothetical protein